MSTINNTDQFVIGRGSDAHRVSASDMRAFMTEVTGDISELHLPKALTSTATSARIAATTTETNHSNQRQYVWTPDADVNGACAIFVFEYQLVAKAPYPDPITPVNFQFSLQWAATGRNAKSTSNNLNTFGVNPTDTVIYFGPDSERSVTRTMTRIDALHLDKGAGSVTFDLNVQKLKCSSHGDLIIKALTRILLVPFKSA